ncbi:hypothetical protein [Enterococcus avium]|uniref:hypothetical protein n=1 Tax=Enterococcus avium TaxID=33945 RepID=UPI0032E47CAD
MKIKKQKELIDSFLRTLDAEDKSVYRDIIVYLSELGYNPKKERSHISFKHSRHNKQIAKIGIRNKKELSHFFALRFSACNDYSQKFAEIVRTNIEKYPSKTPGCIDNTCDYCAGEPDTHIYSYTLPRRREKSPLRSQRTGNSEYLRRRFQRDQTAY